MNAPDPPAVPPEEIKAVPVRHPGRWVASVIVLVIAVAVINSMATNKRFGWGDVGHYLFDSRITGGVVVTIELTIAAMALGIAIGVVLAVMRLSPNPLISGGSWLYVWFFRGTPVIVQLIFWYVGIAALYPTINLGIPFGPQFIHINSVTAITGFVAIVLALGLNEGAYMSEIVRAGIISVDEGQTEAAQSLGMTRLQTMRRIVLPQAMRVIIPPTGNETISMLKTTSLAVVVAGDRAVLLEATKIYNANYEMIPLLIVASHLVSRADLGPLRRPVLPRALLRARLLARAAADAAAEDSPRDLLVRTRPGRARSARTPAPRSGGAMTLEPMVQGRGRPQALRPPRGAARHHARGRPRRGDVHHRAVRVGQVDLPALRSTTSRRSTAAACRWTASSSATASAAASSTSSATARSPSAAPRSAWCSSASTCSRT